MIDVLHLVVVAGNPMVSDSQTVSVAKESIDALKAVLEVQQISSGVAINVARTFLGFGLLIHFFKAGADGSLFRGMPLIFAQFLATMFLISHFGDVVGLARSVGDQMAGAFLNEQAYAEYWKNMGSYAGKIAETSRQAADGGVTGAVAAAVGWFAGGWSTVLLFLSYLVAMIGSWIVGYGRELFLALIVIIGPLALALTLMGIFNTLGSVAQMLAAAMLWKPIGAAMFRLNLETTNALLGVVPSVETNIKLIVLNVFFAVLTIFACTVGSMLLTGRLSTMAGLAITAGGAKLMLASGAAANRYGTAAGHEIMQGTREGAKELQAAGQELSTIANYVPPRPQGSGGITTQKGTPHSAGLAQPWYTPEGFAARRDSLNDERAGRGSIMPNTAVSDRELMNLRKDIAANPESQRGTSVAERRTPENHDGQRQSGSIDDHKFSRKDWDQLSLDDRKRAMEGKQVGWGGYVGKTVSKENATPEDYDRMTPEQRGAVVSGGSVELELNAEEFAKQWQTVESKPNNPKPAGWDGMGPLNLGEGIAGNASKGPTERVDPDATKRDTKNS